MVIIFNLLFNIKIDDGPGNIAFLKDDIVAVGVGVIFSSSHYAPKCVLSRVRIKTVSIHSR